MTFDPQQFEPAFERALADRFVLRRRLGRGGMGIVYLAFERSLDRFVAIKLLPPHRAGDEVVRERFLREAQTAASLSHPNIVPVFSVNQAGDFVFFVMAHVLGDTLGDRLREQRRLDEPLAIRIIRDVAGALGYAHTCGVVHRDIKPDNILIEAATGRALVTDFGIARGLSKRPITGPQRLLGTAEFMSPEQIRGEPATPRSDVYSLGVVAYVTLTGRVPFQGPDDLTILAHHVSTPAPPLLSRAPWVSPALAQVVDRCLAKEPEARFADGYELTAALQGSRATAEPPLAIRAFLAESAQLSIPTTGYVVLVGAGALPLLAWSLLEGSASRALLAATAALLVLPVMVALGRVRRLLRAGHTRAVLVDALRAAAARRKEELAFVHGSGPGRVERWLRRLTLGALAAGTGAAALGAWAPLAPNPLNPWGLALGAAAVALVSAFAARGRAELREDPRLERRLRIWRGPVGRALFGLAAWIPGIPAPAPAWEPSHSLD